ncbi:MAG: hypothetical protein PHQ54_05335, partial [Candidatus Omnitrophica bacterium]|nr:hypothetical protein [Candidatus Omnitrophota bacterium]
MKNIIFTILTVLFFAIGPALLSEGMPENDLNCRRVKNSDAQAEGLTIPDIVVPIVISGLIPIGSGDLGPVNVVYLRIPGSGNPGFISRLKNWLKGDISLEHGIDEDDLVVADPVIISDEMFANMIHGGVQIGVPLDWFWLWRRNNT